MSGYDFFISHARTDRERYIDPLVALLRRKGVKCWLDTAEIGWGDNFALSEGLGKSKFVLLCLSSNFLRRPWPETELGAALAIQNNESRRRVLPLILDSKKEVLSQYQILAGLTYREFSVGVDSLVEELVTLAGSSLEVVSSTSLKVKAESTYTSKECEFLVEPRTTVKWLSDKLQAELGVSVRAETGAPMPFMVRWVPVDVRAEKHWLEMSRAGRRRLYGTVMSAGGLRLSYSARDRLEDLGVYDGTLFHLYSIEDEDYDVLPESAAKTLH
jgi:TIR domain-containing protein